MSDTIYQMVTDQILRKLDEGVIPWQRPWTPGAATLPANLKSKRPYRGINIVALWMAGYESPWWLTYKQAQELGGQVRKGEHATTVVFWKQVKIRDKDESGEETTKTIPMLRYYRVFNVEQIDGLPEGSIPAPAVVEAEEHDPIEAAERIVAGFADAPPVTHGGDRACYLPARDLVMMPERHTFETAEGYYATLFHELAHSTGHETRLARREAFGNGFGTERYSKEELVAEIASAFLSAISGIGSETIDNSAAYVASWSAALRANPKWAVQAGGAAQRAADYIQGIVPEATKEVT